MGCSSGPDIIQDGLVLCLDAGSKRSYSGSGTNFINLSGDIDADLINSPSFSSENGGSLLFDGTDEYVRTYAFSGSSSGTISLWVKWVGTGQDSGYRNYASICSLQKNGSWSSFVCSITNSDPDLAKVDFGTTGWSGGAISSKYVGNNVWRSVTCAWDAASIDLYIDGAIDGTTTYNGANIDATIPFSIGAWIGDGASYLTGNISTTTIYSRKLLADEIRQNYLSTKERFA